ncbi:hypothetical protein HDU76_004364 [Blyttiomyces sp. JEL0837]|nr:hypothetical protein HDU76_004364 [Blyttiomyces sp. JEL0837]
MRAAHLYLKNNTFDPLRCQDIPRRLVAEISADAEPSRPINEKVAAAPTDMTITSQPSEQLQPQTQSHATNIDQAITATTPTSTSTQQQSTKKPSYTHTTGIAPTELDVPKKLIALAAHTAALVKDRVPPQEADIVLNVRSGKGKVRLATGPNVVPPIRKTESNGDLIASTSTSGLEPTVPAVNGNGTGTGTLSPPVSTFNDPVPVPSVPAKERPIPRETTSVTPRETMITGAAAPPQLSSFAETPSSTIAANPQSQPPASGRPSRFREITGKVGGGAWSATTGGVGDKVGADGNGVGMGFGDHGKSTVVVEIDGYGRVPHHWSRHF